MEMLLICCYIYGSFVKNQSQNNYTFASVFYQGHQFGRPLIPYDFLKGILTSNFRDMGNVRPSVFGLIKMSFRVPKKLS